MLIWKKLTGEKIDFSEVPEYLSLMGISVEIIEKEHKYICSLPPYRHDGLHQVDLIEDFAISRGYSSFKPQRPEKLY